MTVLPIATQCPGHGGMYDLTTERSFDLKATCVIDMLPIGVRTTRH